MVSANTHIKLLVHHPHGCFALFCFCKLTHSWTIDTAFNAMCLIHREAAAQIAIISSISTFICPYKRVKRVDRYDDGGGSVEEFKPKRQRQHFGFKPMLMRNLIMSMRDKELVS